MFGNKVVEFVKQQAAVLFQGINAAGANGPASSTSVPAKSEADEEREYQVLLVSMMGALYMGAGADGEVTEDEYEHLKATFREVSEGAVDGEEFDELFDKTADQIDEEGFDVVIADIAKNVTDQEQRYSVLTMAMAAALADGQPDESEQELIHAMAEAFGISQQQLEAYYTEVNEQTN
jgi:uncharacterized tellurite resistance protein B-like protein